MSTTTIRNALGVLQDDSENESAWDELAQATSAPSATSPGGPGAPDLAKEKASGELAKLFEAARHAHESRREYEAASRILDQEIAIAKGTPRELPLVLEQARILDEELLDDMGAIAAYARVLELRPGDRDAEDAIEKSDAKRARWPEIVAKYVEESKGTEDPHFKSSLLVSGAEVAYRFGRPALIEALDKLPPDSSGGGNKKGRKKLDALMAQIEKGLKRALEIDPKNRRAGLLLERVYRWQKNWDGVATVLGTIGAESTSKDDRIAGYVRLARLAKKQPDSKDRAAAAYREVIDLSPANTEAASWLVDHFTEKEDWDDLVALYEEQLSSGVLRHDDVGVILQVAMVHWKMRGRPEAAEPYFERVRRIEPAHPQMLAFFRGYCAERGESARLTQLLQDAVRAVQDGGVRASLNAEIARLAEEGANATKAIDQWRALLRQDPSHKSARDALKRLYRQSSNWTALADVLRGELERVPQDDREARLALLREVAAIYRDHVKQDSTLATVLAQIATLDPDDRDAVRELTRCYAALGRWRDLLTTQTRLADIESDPAGKAELYREVARRWLEQFSNVQNAVEAYEKLHQADPLDAEAIEKLKELYTKRRAYKPLYDLLADEAANVSGETRRGLWLEMAKLAAERLDRGADAIALYKRVLAEDPAAPTALDLLEKQAERDKDFATLAEVLERRVELAPDAAQKLVVLQKLGAIYTERLKEHAGAMSAWRRVLDLSPGHAKALRVLRDTYLAAGDFDGLTELYSASADWEGLAEVLSSAADKASDADAKVELSYRAADVYAERLEAPERAFRAYERVLLVRHDDRRAALALVPLYEKDEKWSRLPALYEVLLKHAETAEERLALYRKLAQVSGERLQDRAAAFRYAQKAYELSRGDDQALDAFEKSARASGEWQSFAAALGDELREGGADATRQRRLRARIAETYAVELGRIDDAVLAYRALVEEDEKDDASVHALDKILRAADRRDELRWLFDLRASRANTAQKIHIFLEWAGLEEDVFGAPEKAIAIYRKILELVPQHGLALRSLSRLLRAAGDAEGAAEAIERDRDQREGADRAAREVELARLYMGPLKRPGDALAAARRAIDLAPTDHSAVEVVEELLHVPETRGKAAILLEGIYDANHNGARQAEVLEVMIATAAAKGDRIALYQRLADVNEQKLGAAKNAFDVIARAASEFPSDLPLWDRLAVLANRTGRAQAFVDAIAAALPPHGDTDLPRKVELDLAERAATLYDEMLGELERARPYLERILAKEPTNDRAFSRLKQILTSLERWPDLEALYESAVSAASDPMRKADLLAEVALVAEEITGDRPKAIEYYERILALEPNHEQAVRALDALYASQSDWPKLAALLRARVEGASLDEAVALKLRLGTLYFSRLDDPTAALGYLEEVLQAEPTSREGRDLVEKCLDVPALRPRAASVLEQVYIAQDSTKDLVRVLEVRLETAGELADRKELLRRVAELRDERLNDGAFGAFARLVPIAPEDGGARARLLELAKKFGHHEEAARVLTESAKVASAPQPRAEILSEVAKLYEEHLGEPARAEAVYREVLDIDPDDPVLALPAARSLERIYAGTGKPRDLAQILQIQVKLEDDAQARRVLHGRLGELAENELDDPKAAIEAWKARLEDDPIDERALSALDRLYERTGNYRALVDVLRARERHTEEPPRRRVLMARIATTLADRLSDVLEAILAYRALLDEFGPDKEVLASLEVLYEVADRWEELAETIEHHLELTDTPADRIALLSRLGLLRDKRLGDVHAAIEAYRQALVIDASHAPSRAALESLLENDAARHDAAEILRPLYEADGDMERLLRVIDIELDFTEDAGGRIALCARAVEVAEGPLHDVKRAYAYAARALRLAATEPELPEWLVRTERLAVATGAWADFSDLLDGLVPDILDETILFEVTLKMAQIARTHLGDRGAARRNYVKALELRGTDRRALEALESLYEEAGDSTALLDILKRRAEVAESDAEKKKILFKEARLCDETLKDAPAAIDVYEEIVELGPDEQAFAALERLYSSTERWDDLMALYERQIGMGAPGDKKATLHHKLGVVLETRLHEVERAFDQYEEALRFDPQHPATVASLEGLMDGKTHAARAAEMLEAVYLARLDWRRVMASIEARLEASQEPDERRQLLKRLAKLHEEQEENYRAALETTAKLLAEDVTDETTWAELERLARVANAEPRLAEIYAAQLDAISADEPATARLSLRTGEIYEKQKDVDRALQYYRRAYAFAPEEAHVGGAEGSGAFAAMDRLLRDAGRPRERVDLYREALEHRHEPKDRLETLATIARLEEEDLNDEDAAIETFRAALDVDDTNVRTLESLGRLYESRKRYRELADLTRMRAEHSALPQDEARFRYQLGKLFEEKLGDASQAIDEYHAVVEVAPEGAAARDAVTALEALLKDDAHKARVVDLLRPIYERADDWRRLVTVNDERLAIASDPGEQVEVLRETAKLWEERGGDRVKAFDAMREAFVIDPDDGEARAELDRLAEATSRWDDLADAYERAIARSEGIGKKELLGALARLHDARRDDPRRALDAWDRLHQLDETDIEPLEAMDSLATLLSDWPTLVRVLTKKAELVANDEDRASTWRRVGEARRDMLDDAPGAIEAYERALELEHDSAFTLDLLIALYEAKDDSARLVALYRRRVELCGEDDEGLKFQLLVDAANRYEERIGDRREAIQHLIEALAVKPRDLDVTRRLDRLYTQEKMWPELLDNLRQLVALTGDETEKRTLRKRIGALLASELEDPEHALEAYRDVLAGGFDDDAAKAVRALGESREELRREAALVLEPVLRTASRHGELADVLEMRLAAETDPEASARTLRSIAEVAERQLGDADRALAALLRALAFEPASPELHADIERLAETIGAKGWERYADALAERAGAIFDAGVTSELFTRLGKVAEERLKDDARAAQAYKSAGEQAGDTGPVLGALDRLYGRLGDARALSEVLERRIAMEDDPASQAGLLHRLASLQIEEFGERALGLATLRQAVERAPEFAPSRVALEELLHDPLLFDDAFDALEDVYRALARSEDLARLYEHKVTRAQDARERSRARLELARILELEVKDAARAQRMVEAATLDEPSDHDVLAELERLAGETNGFAVAAEALEKALGPATDLAPATAGDLWVRLAGWRRDKLDDPRGAEAAYRRALALEPEHVEILREVEQLQRAPGRERDLVATLRARVKLEVDVDVKRRLLKEAKQVAETTLADRDLAEACLRDLLAEDEGDLWALEELTRLRDLAGARSEVIDLLLRRAELEADGKTIAELRHRAAGVLREGGESDRAIKIYEELLEGDPTDAEAASRLRELYEEGGRHKDLARLLQLLIDGADSPASRATLRLDLAKLHERLDAPADAADTLRAILDEEPTHPAAVLALSSLLEKTGQDEDLAELLTSQMDRAQERGDEAAELALKVRLGEVFENRLKDTPRALSTFEAVLAREPHHRGALEAVARLAEGRSDWARAAGALATLAEMDTGAAGVATALRLAAALGQRGDDAGVEAALRRAIELDPPHEEARAQLRALYERTKNHAALADLLVADADLVAAAHPEAMATRDARDSGDVRSSARPPAASIPPAAPVPPPALDVVKLLRRAAEIHLNDRRAPADAVPLLERATALVPQDRELLLLLCDAYSAAGRERESAQVLERVIASFGPRRTKELSAYHHRLGKALAQLGDRDAALTQLDMAFKIDPGSVAVLRDLGVLALETSDLERAQKTFRALLLQRLDPSVGITKGEVFYYLGEVSARQGDKAKAVQMLERAIENEPTLDRAKTKLQELKG